MPQAPCFLRETDPGLRNVGHAVLGRLSSSWSKWASNSLLLALAEAFLEAKEVLLALRTKRGFSQEELAERLFVTRQAVSRWEMGETLPGPETLQRLSALYDVSINTLLSSPRRLVCQCCGMPLEDDGVLSREPDGSFNEDYCKWCYTGGKFVYSSLEELIEFLAGTMATAERPPEQVRAYLRARLPGLGHWKGK